MYYPINFSFSYFLNRRVIIYTADGQKYTSYLFKIKAIQTQIALTGYCFISHAFSSALVPVLRVQTPAQNLHH
jgi:hypothetical protein